MPSKDKAPIAIIRFGEKLEVKLGEHQGEPVLVTRHNGEQVIVFRLEDIETLIEIYAEQCLPEDGVYQ